MNKRKIQQGVEVSYNSAPFPAVKGYRVHNDDNIYLFGSIDSPFDFVDAIEVLSKAEQDDVVTLHVSGPGGCVSSVDALLHAIETAQKKGVVVHSICSGLVASAMTFIPLACTSFELSNGFHALIHNGSLSDGGSFNQYRASTSFYLKYMEERLRDVYQFFLTEEELDAVMDGKDIWLTPEEWGERYEKRNAMYIAQQHEDEELPYEDE